ncbi:RICIN domain-containing protein [Streptomyces sp. Inha503]|uniref:RICIN domain-containing protein n=1 Tax=Streptomyces sp. Inha503 TaxID=3383314 RepID=UPI00399F10EE
MSLGEEPDKPKTGDERHAAGEPADLDEPESIGEPPETSSPLAVIISGDGSASIDGVPVPVVGEEQVDTAILDTLHGYARGRNAPVTATISDPSEGYVVIVEVAPDGSSRLLEQHGEEPDGDETREFAGPGAYPGPSGVEAGPPDAPDASDVPHVSDLPDVGDVDEFDDFGDEPVSTPGPAQPALTTPAPSPGLDRKPIRRRQLDQSDDEYESPGLLKRPLFVGVAGVALAAVVVVPLIVIGSSGGGGERNLATGGTESAEKSPPTPSKSASPSPSSSRSSSPSPSASPSAPPKPTDAPKAAVDPRTYKGGMLIKNKKYGLCVDLPGSGKSAPDTEVKDATCKSDDNQGWVLNVVSQGGGRADQYLIRNTKSDLCLDLPGNGSASEGAQMGMSNCNNSKEKDNQLWWLGKRSDDSYRLRNQKSRLCLTTEKSANSKVTISKCGEAEDQEWSFVES